MNQKDVNLGLFKGRLLYARYCRGWTQDTLAAVADLKPWVISHWETDRSDAPDARIIKRLADALEVTVGWLAFQMGDGPL